MGNKNRDYSYSMTVSNLAADEADDLAYACKKAKRKYASNGRGSSFTGKTKDLHKHLSNSTGYLENDDD